jgi:hypothetical protein
MAYTIQILKGGTEKRDRILAYLQERLVKEGTFRATLTPIHDNKGNPCIVVKPVRLLKKKPYCGNHPGECVVNPFFGARKKPNVTFLEWDDWVKFHGVVNRVLNRFHTHANVWSNPQDVRGKMWIRKDLKPRIKYEWTEDYNSIGLPIRTWNQGTEDQFS